MATLQNQYQVLKLKSDFIVARNLNVENYSKSQAAKDGALVSIGDNLVFQQIRKFYDDKRTHRERCPTVPPCDKSSKERRKK